MRALFLSTAALALTFAVPAFAQPTQGWNNGQTYGQEYQGNSYGGQGYSQGPLQNRNHGGYGMENGGQGYSQGYNQNYSQNRFHPGNQGFQGNQNEYGEGQNMQEGQQYEGGGGQVSRAEVRRVLEESGLHNIHILDESYLVSAETREGNQVLLVINPPSNAGPSVMGGEENEGGQSYGQGGQSYGGAQNGYEQSYRGQEGYGRENSGPNYSGSR